MKAIKSYLKAFACAGIIFVILGGLLVGMHVENLSYRLGYVFASCLLPALVTGTWGAFSKKPWSWGRFAATVIGFYLAFGLLVMMGKTPR